MKVPVVVTALLLCVTGLSLPLSGQATTKDRKPPPLSHSPAVLEFIAEMHEKHGFDTRKLTHVFSTIHVNPTVLGAIRPAAVPEMQRSWARYRERFLNERRIAQGVRFWKIHGQSLAHAESQYGVPPEIIVAIIGIETEYGQNTGKFRAIEALATLAFEYPPRAPFFRNELVNLLLMARENSVDPREYRGSSAGAIGIPQFMPSSQRLYAVDFDGDKRIDLRRSPVDAIGSVAHYLGEHGWKAGAPIAWPATVEGDPTPLIEAGIKPIRALRELLEEGIDVAGDLGTLVEHRAALVDLVSPDRPTEYWVGFDNFYVITRYNRSSFYAMSVFQLAEALREASGVNRD